MSKKWIWLIVATSLVILGTVIFAASACAVGWDFDKISTEEYQTKEYELGLEFENISLKTSTAAVRLERSADEKCRVVCYESTKQMHDVKVEEGTLKVAVVDTRKWYEYISIRFTRSSPMVTVYLPDNEYGRLTVSASTGAVKIPAGFTFEEMEIEVSTGAVECCADVLYQAKIKTSTGAVNVENAVVGELEIEVSTGAVSVSDLTCSGGVTVNVSTGKTQIVNVTCASVKSSGNTGRIYLSGTVASEKISVIRTTGDVELDRSDAAEIYIKTDTGDVEGSLLSGKVFTVKTDTGRIDVPSSSSGGICEITTDTGDVEIEIAKA